MEVREGMSSIVLAVGPGHTLREAASKMTEKGTGAALVFDDESPRIITERDILNALGAGVDPDTATVAQHMSESVISAPPDWSLERAAEEMVKLGIRHLVVVEAGELVGVLSMRDIVRVWTTAGATSSMTPPKTWRQLSCPSERVQPCIPAGRSPRMQVCVTTPGR